MTTADPNPADPALTDLSRRAFGLLRLTGLLLLTAIVALLALWAASPALPFTLRAGRLLPLALSAATLACAGVSGATILAATRLRAEDPPRPRRRLFRLPLPRRIAGDPARIGRAARWPQVLLVGPIGLLAAAFAALPPGPGHAPVWVGGAAILLAFPLLVAERSFAALDARRLPEAQAVRRLLLVPVLVWPAAGLLEIAGALGLAIVPAVEGALALLLGLLAIELALRAMARAFLPPPAPAEARAAIDPLLTRLLADGIRTGSLGSPVRTHLGIDFSRSWALHYVRSAGLPILLVLGLVTWGLSGVVLLGMDSRAIDERFGAPVAVMGPGLHVILPWPMGRARHVEYGVLHEVAPDSETLRTAAVAPAEGPAPAEADRLWEQAHPAEQILIVASHVPATGTDDARKRDSFQVISADIRLRYRVGMSDADALRAAYAAAEPETLLRAIAGQVVAAYAAGHTLDQLLGGNREQLGAELRDTIQARLDRAGTGLELSAVVVEAIHPPAGAAEAYHAVQAAGIMAEASIAAERGRAAAAQSHAAQYAADLVASAQAGGAEATGRATADTASFVADRDAARAHPNSFLLERRLAALSAGLAKSTLTILDRRLKVAPTVDLRPLTPMTATTVPRDAE